MATKQIFKPIIHALLSIAVLMGFVCIIGIAWNRNAKIFRAKTSEAVQNLEEICQAEQVYFRANGVFLEAGATPNRRATASSTPFVSPDLYAWTTLGWKPKRDVRCQYAIILTNPERSNFQAIARCDEDGDGDFARYQVEKDCFVTRLTDTRIY